MAPIPKILITAPRILFTIPEKANDATTYTAVWGRKGVAIARQLGYNVFVLQKDQVTRANVEKAIREFRPRAFIHLGHGCTWSLQSNKECILNKRHSVDEIMSLAYSGCECDRKKALELLSYNYDLNDGSRDPCELSCIFDSNIQELEGCVVIGIACHSAAGLGRAAINSGIQSYAGNNDLLIFPVDRLKTQEVYGDMELEFVHQILLGHTFRDAKKAKLKMMDTFITKNKRIKYLALTALFNRLNFEILGDLNATIFT